MAQCTTTKEEATGDWVMKASTWESVIITITTKDFCLAHYPKPNLRHNVLCWGKKWWVGGYWRLSTGESIIIITKHFSLEHYPKPNLRHNTHAKEGSNWWLGNEGSPTWESVIIIRNNKRLFSGTLSWVNLRHDPPCQGKKRWVIGVMKAVNMGIRYHNN